MTEIAPFVTPGSCPYGIVVRIYGDNGTVLVEHHVEIGTDGMTLDLLAGAADDAVRSAAEANPDLAEIVVAGYDGDSGELMISDLFVFERGDDADQ